MARQEGHVPLVDVPGGDHSPQFALDHACQELRRPGVTEPDATQSSSEKLRCTGTRIEMRVPGDARVLSIAWTRLPSASLGSMNGTASAKLLPTARVMTEPAP
jgi:hypothetical protein